MAAKSFPSHTIHKGTRLSSKSAAPADVKPSESELGRLDGSSVQDFAWQILAISARLEGIQAIWASAFDVTRPQWLILSAVHTLDEGGGVPVKEVSAKLAVDPSFVTTQSKMLEKQGLVRRVTSKEDARVVLMSLTDRTLKKMAKLHPRHVAVDELVFSGLSDSSISDIKIKLEMIRERLTKAALIIKAED